MTYSKRAEIDNKYKWKLEDIYENEELWEVERLKVEELLPEVKKYEGKLVGNPDLILSLFKLEEEIGTYLERLYTYASMKSHEDTTISKYQSMVDMISNLSVKVSNETSFISPELLNIEENELKDYYNQNSELRYFKPALDKLFRRKKHVLSKEKEELLSEVGNISSVAESVFDMLNDADMKFGTVLDENGAEIQLTKGKYSQLMESKNRDVRKDAFLTLYKSYTDLKNTFASTLYGNIKTNVFYSKIRNYPSALEASLYRDNISKDVYDNLIKTVRYNLKPLHEYMDIRKKVLNVDELHFYDLSAPLIEDDKKEIKFEEAYGHMMEGLKPLGEEYIAKLQEAFDSGWIDVFETPGKHGGAYCWGPHGTHPYVLLNHENNINGMFTLAHEMGHAMHSYYSDMAQPKITAQYVIFVAEVASTVNEVLLMHHLLKNTQDKNMKLNLLNYFIDQFRTTLYRQTMFAEFEKITHETVEKGIPLTSDSLSDVYLELNKSYYGPNMTYDESIAYEWSRIPHFYSPFYVYKYATGFSAAVHLAKEILEKGEPAVNKYIEFLKSGSIDYPISLLEKAGVNMSSPEPIENALKVFEGLVTELSSLLETQ